MSDAVGCLFRGLFDAMRFIWNRWTCNKIVGIVLPRGSGKTHICKNFTSQSKDCLIVDLEEAVLNSTSLDDAERIRKLRDQGHQETANTLLYPMVRDWVAKLKQDFRYKTLYFLSSDLKLIRYLSITEIYCFVPSTEFAQTIENRVDEAMRAVIKDSRLDLILQQGKRAIAFSDWQNLGTMLAQIVKIVPKL